MGARATRALHWARRHAVGLASVALALAVVGPLLTPGFVLAYDMVFIPSPHFSRQLLGISRLLPRAVPTELIVAAASHVLTGQVTQKLILFGILGGASLGAARLVPSSRPAARIGGGVLYAWNPMTFERLLLGQWVLLAGYAVLPWVASAALAFRRGEPGSGLRLTLWLGAAAALGPYCAIFAVPVAAAIALAPPWNRGGPVRKAGLLICAAVAVNLPWLGPALLHPASPGAATLGLQLFRARADSPVGTLGSLVSLGGVWRTDLAPPGRDTLGWVPAFALMAVLIVWGWRALGTRWPRGARAGLLALAGLGLALAVAPAVPGARDVASWLDRVLPGGGLIRDTQKFVVPLALAEAVGFGLGVDRLLEAVTRSKLESRALVVVAALAAIAPIALAPTLAWGAGGRLQPSRYPPSWAEADRAMSADPVAGAALALPWHAYLPFGWNHGRAVHQPALVYFSRPVVSSSALEVGSFVLPEEDPWARLARPAAVGGQPLASRLSGLGVRYVVLFKEADWMRFIPDVEGLTPVLDTTDLTLYRAPPPRAIPAFRTPPVGAVLALDGVALVTLVVGAAGIVRRRLASTQKAAS